MSDPDQPGEDFDDELLAGDYPPDRPLGVEAEGVTELEELGGESFEERDENTRPEVWDEDDEDEDADEGDDEGVELVGDAGVIDEEDELVGEAVDEGGPGPLAPDDEFTGDETTRDVASERAPEAAEDAAVHIEDDES
jgi:hypothetical protein